MCAICTGISCVGSLSVCTFFFFNDTATTEIYTLSLHDALPIYRTDPSGRKTIGKVQKRQQSRLGLDRKSTRLNSSHDDISYAVFCLKKKNQSHTLYDACLCPEGPVRCAYAPRVTHRGMV